MQTEVCAARRKARRTGFLFLSPGPRRGQKGPCHGNPPCSSRITGYWTRRSGDFAAQRRRELAGEKHAQWLAELNRYIPAGGGWNILDLGTGSGFFALLLAAQGHTVTGIDLTPAMIDEAPPAPPPRWAAPPALR